VSGDKQPEEHTPWEGVSEQMKSLVDQVGVIGELANEDAEETFAPCREGRCLACHAPVGDTAMFIITDHGIVGVYCGGACLQDIALVGWLQEELQDVTTRIHFRGGTEADEAEETQEGTG
jgi:hypothetical protein